MTRLVYPALLLTILLSGCAGVETTPAPVEDRSAAGKTGKRPDTATQPEDLPDSAGGAIATTGPANVSQSAPTASPASSSLPDPANTPDQPVVLAVLDEAETLASRGDMAHAMASLERGIRIKPKDPWLWHQLGVLKLRDHQWLDAIAMAEKSNSLAGNNHQLLSGNWMIIAEANEALGELAASRAAHRQAEYYSGDR